MPKPYLAVTERGVAVGSGRDHDPTALWGHQSMRQLELNGFEASDSVVCVYDECNKRFDTTHGMRIHHTRMHGDGESRTKRECIQALWEAETAIGHPPYQAEMQSLDITPAVTTIQRKFDGWSAAKEVAQTAKEESPAKECIAGLREAAEELGHAPTRDEYDELGVDPKYGKIRSVFGKWNVAKDIAGLKTVRNSDGTLNVNEEFFECIDSPLKAYWLGVFYADGSVYGTARSALTSQLGFKVTDITLLEKYRNDIQSEHTISVSPNSGKGDRAMAQIQIGNYNFNNHLTEHGVGPSGKQDTPTLEKEHIPPFIRGYFDGDGCIRRKSGQKGYTWRITSINRDRLRWVKDQFSARGISNLNISTRDPKQENHSPISEIRAWDPDTISDIYSSLWESDWRDVRCLGRKGKLTELAASQDSSSRTYRNSQ